MAFGPQARPIATEEQLLSLAAALKAQAAQRYRDLASWAADHEDAELDALFRELCAMQVEHGEHVLSASLQRLGHEVTPATTQLLAARFEEPDLRSALLTPYGALSIAVRNEERSFAFYAEAAAYAETPMVRALAEDLARAELGHAAKLRRARRAAYRAEVSGERAARRAPPPGDLPALDRESAPWEAEAANASTRTARLGALSRNVERYLRIAEEATNEAVLNVAQERAAQTLRRLVTMRDSA